MISVEFALDLTLANSWLLLIHFDIVIKINGQQLVKREPRSLSVYSLQITGKFKASMGRRRGQFYDCWLDAVGCFGPANKSCFDVLMRTTQSGNLAKGTAKAAAEIKIVSSTIIIVSHAIVIVLLKYRPSRFSRSSFWFQCYTYCITHTASSSEQEAEGG